MIQASLVSPSLSKKPRRAAACTLSAAVRTPSRTTKGSPAAKTAAARLFAQISFWSSETRARGAEWLSAHADR